ncbi:MAG: hypothetical protein NC094_10635 [Bacteroidales bacterium]|nr:hypothetical protein [Lachnoclostridium sp.]MCM1384975.1 hypothetical protein [Lachnoclostridium sp.]MCM1465863.1 hypothetical protein [Bacteroidales bacterium]
MVEYILGNYLIESGKLKREQLKLVMEKEDSVTVSPELKAAEEGQSGHYLMFVQALLDEKLITLDELEWLLNDFGAKNGYNAEQINDIKSDEVERIIPLLMPKEAGQFVSLVCTMVSTMVKSFDKHIYVGKAAMVDQLPAEDLVNQSLVWEDGIVDCFSERDGGLLMVSSVYGQEEYGQLDSDALDAAGELLNCINGLYVSGLSREGYFLEMMPPKYEECSESVKKGTICRIPIFFDERGFYFTVAELV